MTATQTLELLNERGMMVAPVMGRMFSEYIGGLSYREVDLLTDMRDRRGRPILPQMPPALIEAQGEHQVKDIHCRLAMSARMSEVAAFNRSVDQLHQWAGITGDQSILDPVDFETAVPESMQISGVPIRWTSTPQKIAAKQKNRAAAQKQAAQIQALPAQAAMLKAQAAVQTSGKNCSSRNRERCNEASPQRSDHYAGHVAGTCAGSPAASEWTAVFSIEIEGAGQGYSLPAANRRFCDRHAPRASALNLGLRRAAFMNAMTEIKPLG